MSPVSAHDVAAELRRQLPGLPTKKLHKLLYYCQGHHLTALGEPLFTETISAWDMGPVVGNLWYAEGQRTVADGEEILTEAQLNTIGYVLSRYGALSGKDLENLTHSEMPWQRADQGRRPAGSARIELEWIKEYFDASNGEEDDEIPLDAAAVAEWLQDADTRRAQPSRRDTIEELLARL